MEELNETAQNLLQDLEQMKSKEKAKEIIKAIEDLQEEIKTYFLE